MKTLITLIIALLFTITSFAQQGINYKAVIKDNQDNALANELIEELQFTITTGISAVYQETHSATTDDKGIIIVNIGEGTPTAGTFDTIDWSNGSHFLNVQINTGNGLTDMGTSQFMAVPYALFAANVATKIDDLSDAKSDANGSSLFIGIEAGSNDDGTNNDNVGLGFGVLNANTTGYNNSAIGNMALNANITGYSNTANGNSALLNNTTGFRNTAIGTDALLYNTTGNSNTAIGNATLLFNTTGNYNTANGSYALHENTTGNNNTANGVVALNENTSGNNNTANGYAALFRNTTGNENTANGSFALEENTTGDYNTANGFTALKLNTTGSQNTAVGYAALQANDDGNYNTAIGFQALFLNQNGTRNTASGHNALGANIGGSHNTAKGYYALNNNTSGNQNTSIGYFALHNNNTGDGNIAIGKSAGSQNVSGNNNIFIGVDAGGIDSSSGAFSNKLYINNGASDNPLIYGEFDTDLVSINGTLDVNGSFKILNASDDTSTWRLETRPNGSLSLYRNGDYRGYFNESTGNYSSISDRKTKKNITALENGTLNKVMQLNPVSYLMKDQTDTKRNLGLISQEVKEIFPSITTYIEESDLITLSYSELIPVLIKALQEQQDIIEAQNAKDVVQDKSIETLVARLNLLESKSSN
ncbi:tail fiber domain-containing protein [Winogradskyella schleiferi]|uniref:tail fiber domain-containing protein n=1 Tax=Winogradskyella schleiferi TaxID=2686078 RepID=UPI0015B99A93|nr:tail fiber domain-containing protein [Winogradskyella schleiferi]